MIHTILRNLQKAFFLSAAVLMLFAFDQLKHFDVEYFSATGGPMTAGGELHHPSYLFQSGSSEEEETSSNSFLIGASHQLMFGKEIKIGLFRFVLPRLELTTTPSPEQYQRVSSSSKSTLEESKETLRKRKKQLLRPGARTWQGTSMNSTVVFVVDLRMRDWVSCSDALHEAQIVRHSFLSTSSDNFEEPWHLLLPRTCTKAAMSSLGKRLRLEYHLSFDASEQPPSKYPKNATKALCWADQALRKSDKNSSVVLFKIPGGLFFDDGRNKLSSTTSAASKKKSQEPGILANETNGAVSPSSNTTLQTESDLTVEWLHVDESSFDLAENDNNTNCPRRLLRCQAGFDCDKNLPFFPSNVVLRSWNVPSCSPVTRKGCGRMARGERPVMEHRADNVCAQIFERYCTLTKAVSK